MIKGFSGDSAFKWGIRLLAIGLMVLLIPLITLNLWPQVALEFAPLRPAGWAGLLSLPPAQSFLGWDCYLKGEYGEAGAWMHFFNAWQPTQDSMLLEGRCAQESGRGGQARFLYRKVFAFDPRSRQARLALIDLNLKEMADPALPLPHHIDEILDLVPWDDDSSIIKISNRLLALAESRPGKPRRLLTAAVLNLDPADPALLRKAGVLLLQEPGRGIRRIGAGLVVATLLAESGRLTEKDIQQLDLFLPGEFSQHLRSALLQGRFSRVTATAMIALHDPSDGRMKVSSPADPYPICLEREWHRHLGWIVRHGNDQF